jgi:acetyltransferase-like isoleucine patch superfamily enzyme
MKFKRIIYLSPLGWFLSKILNLLSLISKPYMVYGYTSKQNGKFLKNTRLSSSTVINKPRNLNISDNVWVWHHSVLDASNGITIGKGCQIGAFVGIFSHSSHIAIRLMGDKYLETDINDRVGYIKEKVEIGEYVFIGTSTLIYPGTTIGNGCIVLSGSHVKGTIPDFSVVSGNPAKIITTIDNIDRLYLKNKIVQENYFDKELLNKMLEKFKITKYE